MVENNKDPFYFVAELDTKGLDDAVSRAEKSYISYEKQIKKLTRALGYQDESQQETTKNIIASLEREVKWHKDVEDAIKDEQKARGEAEKEEISSGKKKNGFIDKWKRNEIQSLKKLGISWEDFKGAVSDFALIGGIAAVTAALFKAASAALEFDNILRSIDSSVRQQPKLMGVASESIQKWRNHLGLSEEEIARVVSGIGRLHAVVGKTAKDARVFKGLVDQTIYLSKALDVSTDSTISFYRSWINIYKLPHHRLRNIGSAMKYIQEQTGMSGDELMSFGESLQDILARMTGVSKNAKGKVTVDMMAIAGAFKKMGIEPEKMSSLFEEAMKLDSEKGAEWLGFITRMTGKGAAEVRGMIESGDVETPMLLFQEALKRLGPKNLKLAESYYSDLFGMSYGQMTRMMEESSDGMKSLLEGSRKAYKSGELHAKRTAELEAPITRMWIDLKNAFHSLWLSVGKVVLSIATKLSKYLIPWITRMVNKVVEFVNFITSPEGGRAVNKWINDIFNWFKTKLWPVLQDVGKTVVWLAGGISKLITWLGELSGTKSGLLTWAAGLGAAFTGALGPIGALVLAMKGAKDLADALTDDAVRLANMKSKWVRDQQEADELYFDRKNFFNEIKGLSMTTKEFAVETLSKYMKQGILTEKGEVKKDVKFFEGMGDVIHTQKTIQASLADVGKFYKVSSKEMISAAAKMAGLTPGEMAEKVETQAAEKVATPAPISPATVQEIPEISSPIVTAPEMKPPVVVVPKTNAEKLLVDIRDILKNISVRSGNKNVHPGRLAVEESY